MTNKLDEQVMRGFYLLNDGDDNTVRINLEDHEALNVSSTQLNASDLGDLLPLEL